MPCSRESFLEGIFDDESVWNINAGLVIKKQCQFDIHLLCLFKLV